MDFKAEKPACGALSSGCYIGKDSMGMNTPVITDRQFFTIDKISAGKLTTLAAVL